MINEVMRRRPVLTIPEPRMVKQPFEVGGRTYQPGVVLTAGAYLVHHDPAIYPDPYAFKPERFLEKAGHVHLPAVRRWPAPLHRRLASRCWR